MKWKTSFRIWAWDFILYNLGMAYKNHFYNFICVNLKTRQQRVVGCGDIYSCQNIFYKQMTSFIRQIIFRDTWEVPQWGRVSLLAFGHSGRQSISQSLATKYASAKANKQIIPISPIIMTAGCGVYIRTIYVHTYTNIGLQWYFESRTLGFYRNLIKLDGRHTHMNCCFCLIDYLLLTLEIDFGILSLIMSL